MFAPYCEQHGSRVLLPTTAIEALVRDENGLHAEFLCICGAHGVWAPERVGRSA